MGFSNHESRVTNHEITEENMTREEILEKFKDKRTKCTVYTRVMGYHRPVESFNIGKKGEHKERKHFKENPTVILQNCA